MDIVGIFSRPGEIKRMFAAIEKIDAELLPHFPRVRDVLLGHFKVEAIIAENAKVIVRLIKDGLDPKITAYLFMRVLLEDLLLDGDFHGVDGELSRDGECFLALYNNVIRELRLLKWFSAAQADDYFADIRINLDSLSRAHRIARETMKSAAAAVADEPPSSILRAVA